MPFVKLQLMSCAPLYDIRDCTSEHLETLWHLQGDHFCVVFPNMVDCFMNLERIMCRQGFDRCIETFVLEDFWGNLVA